MFCSDHILEALVFAQLFVVVNVLFEFQDNDQRYRQNDTRNKDAQVSPIFPRLFTYTDVLPEDEFRINRFLSLQNTFKSIRLQFLRQLPLQIGFDYADFEANAFFLNNLGLEFSGVCSDGICVLDVLQLN